ncbi:hypothetical protein RHSIM_Rhsim01G0164600 [Rhododendron simsii]|uniref:FBD domain-containing protein n=1 Tax=Rhododendron simsii TaxID=118357 RepID=A0A834LUG5_RHOSS|nr:hypothetical protein RHSIM_Rhsim01G0164600 [Rhododendron simsii]
MSLLKIRRMSHASNVSGVESELTRYLNPPTIETDDDEPFDLLSWWNHKSLIEISYPHECLKDVEIFGFVDRKFVMYLLQNAINLEKITVDLYHPSLKFMKIPEKEEA